MRKDPGVNGRLLAMITLTGCLFTVIVFSFYLLERRSFNIVTKSAQEQLDKEVESLIYIIKRPLDQIAWDYSFWDEFIEAIDSRNEKWMEENITSILTSYHANYVSVYDENLKLVHQASLGEPIIRNLIPEGALARLLGNPELSFYIMTPSGIFQVSCASIHPTSDPSHTKTKSSGYLFVAKHWNSEFLEELSKLSTSSVELSTTTDTPKIQSYHNLTSSVNLKGYNGNIEARILFHKEYESLRLYTRSAIYVFVILLSLIFTTWMILRITIIKLVVKPLKKVTDMIGNDDLSFVEELKKSPLEYQQIAILFEKHIKQKTELVKAKNKAEESDKLKSAFLANVSHEIRTPMNGILGFAGLLKEPDLTGEQQQKYIKIIEKSGTRMLSIINDIISISKIEAGQIDVHITQFNLNDLQEYIHAFFLPEAEKKGLQLLAGKKLSEEEANIMSDKEKVYAVVTNLVKNATKYTNEGYIKFGFEKKGEEMVFSIKDTGIGIARKNQQMIFNRFVQEESSFSKYYEGAGLGLSISKAYAETLNGKIWVESEQGIGSSFYFSFPYKISLDKDKSTNKESSVSTDNSKKIKILITDDDKSSDMLLSQFLKNVCDNILHAGNGAEAVEICRNNPDIDIILMDIKMPGMDGFEATRQIREFNKSVVIIAQTAFNLASDKEAIFEAGCNDHISKPVMKRDLLSLIEKYSF